MGFLPSLVDGMLRFEFHRRPIRPRPPAVRGADFNPEPRRPIVLTYDDEKERVEKERKSYLAGLAGGRLRYLRMIRYDRSYVLRYNNKSGRGKKDWGPASPLTQCMDRGEVCCAVFGPGQGLSHCTTPTARAAPKAAADSRE